MRIFSSPVGGNVIITNNKLIIITDNKLIIN